MEQNPYSAPQAEMAESLDGDLASRWARFFGNLIDSILEGGIALGILFLTDYWDAALTLPLLLEQAMLMGSGIAVFLVLQGYLLMVSGQTIGKRIMRTRIVSYYDGQLLGPGKLLGLRYILWYVFYSLPFVGGVIGLIDALFIFGEEKRCLHDVMAGSKVVKANRR